MRFFYRILLYAVVPLGIILVFSQGLNYFPVMATCSIKNYTGWDCPGCGGQRAIDALIKGKFKEAFLYNQLIYLYLGVLVYIYVLLIESYIFKNERFMQKCGFSNGFAVVFVLSIGLFFILRNI
ncbi:DUF2752 domain-containing protein [Myroides sp. DW712]|uniref:DUF2752 domain-containing protein n=1 Tax=Myroides sp. DW712 TaxID=3389800 RepID=UPI00397B1541